MKSYYELLTVESSAPAEEIKKAFRREIARYHPDKVEHLGSEFQEIAAARAAALTEAYRVLMDAELRSRYDQTLAEGMPVTRSAPPADRPTPPESPAGDRQEPEKSGPAPRLDNRFARDRASTTGFVGRAALARVGDVVRSLNAEPLTIPSFDAAFAIKGRKGLFTKREPDVRLLVRVVDSVDATAVADTWMPAARAVTPNDTLVVFLLGSGLAPARELAAAISEQRRKWRKSSVMLVPVDMRDWEALLPPETPVAVRALLDRLRQGA